MLQRSLAGQRLRVHSSWEVRDSQLRANRLPDSSRTLLDLCPALQKSPRRHLHPTTRTGGVCQRSTATAQESTWSITLILTEASPTNWTTGPQSSSSPGHVTSQHTWYWPDPGHASTRQTPHNMVTNQRSGRLHFQTAPLRADWESGRCRIPALPLTHAKVGPLGGSLLRHSSPVPFSSSSCCSRGGHQSCISRASCSPGAGHSLAGVRLLLRSVRRRSAWPSFLCPGLQGGPGVRLSCEGVASTSPVCFLSLPFLLFPGGAAKASVGLRDTVPPFTRASSSSFYQGSGACWPLGSWYGGPGRPH